VRFSRFSLAGFGLVIITGPYSHLALSQDYSDAEIESGSLSSSVATRSDSNQQLSNSDSSPVYEERDYVRFDQASKVEDDFDPYIETDEKTKVFEGDVPGDLLGKLQLLQEEVMRLNGLLEQQAHNIRVLEEKSLQRYIDIDRRLSAVDTDTSDSPKNQTETVFFSDQNSIPEQPGEGEAYLSAYGLVKNKKFELAITAFQNFLKEFPDGKFAPNAHFWLGELYLVLDPADPEASRQAFMLLVSQFSQHVKVPDALYKLGKIQLMKGNRERSKYYLNRVISEYSDSNKSVVKLAQDFIYKNNL
tara:strand:+ start:415 stop:1323 length:909 start_codon:yes stop_codon:yes gene_type:complete